MQNKTNPSIFYAAALLKKGYDTINPCCQQSTDGDSQHPSGHQTLRNSPTHSRKPLRGPYSDNSSRNGVCRTYRNLQILRQIKRKRTGSFRNHPFQWRHLRNLKSKPRQQRKLSGKVAQWQSFRKLNVRRKQKSRLRSMT